MLKKVLLISVVLKRTKEAATQYCIHIDLSRIRSSNKGAFDEVCVKVLHPLRSLDKGSKAV